MDIWELMARVRENLEDYGGVWPSTYSQLEHDLERLFAAFEQENYDDGFESGHKNGFDEGYDDGYADAAG